MPSACCRRYPGRARRAPGTTAHVSRDRVPTDVRPLKVSNRSITASVDGDVTAFERTAQPAADIASAKTFGSRVPVAAGAQSSVENSDPDTAAAATPSVRLANTAAPRHRTAAA